MLTLSLTNASYCCSKVVFFNSGKATMMMIINIMRRKTKHHGQLCLGRNFQGWVKGRVYIAVYWKWSFSVSILTLR